ncbi:MAG: hypothetical protein IJ318_00015 [Clostridia bacterium]|nr:hypothetical protein [Clostridia bacterium]
MEKKFSVKYIEVLYYDDKVIPVSYIAGKNGRNQLLFLLNDAKLEIVEVKQPFGTYNKGAQKIVILKTANDTTRYAEYGTLTSALIHYGIEEGSQFANLFRVKKLVDDKNPIDSTTQSTIAREYFNTELSVAEIKALFAELQRGYNASKHSCAGRE